MPRCNFPEESGGQIAKSGQMSRAVWSLLLLLALSVPAVYHAGPYDLSGLQHQVEQIRGLPFKSNVPSTMQTKAEIQAYLNTQLDAETNWRQMTAFLMAFGFVPDNFSTRAVLLSLYGEQVGGYYDPGTRMFYLSQEFLAKNGGSGMGINMADVTIAHELTHALQDQQFDLRGLERRLKDATEDQTLAAESLIEGEATAVMMEQPLRAMGLDPSALGDISGLLQQSGVGSNDYPQFAHAPIYFKHGMMFPYVNGCHFVNTIRQHGGWSRVNKAWQQRLPRSSDDILHPKHWLNNNPLAPAPPLPAFNAAGWSIAAHGTLGEYFPGVLLEQYVPSHPSCETATDGWKADSYAVYQKGSQYGLLWASDWQDAATASRFYGYLKQALSTRRPTMHATGDGQWQLGDGRVTNIVCHNTRVIVSGCATEPVTLHGPHHGRAGQRAVGAAGEQLQEGAAAPRRIHPGANQGRAGLPLPSRALPLQSAPRGRGVCRSSRRSGSSQRAPPHRAAAPLGTRSNWSS